MEYFIGHDPLQMDIVGVKMDILEYHLDKLEYKILFILVFHNYKKLNFIIIYINYISIIGIPTFKKI